MRAAAAAGGLLIVAALVGAVAPGRARACSFAGPTPHTIDSALVGVDQTPPTLPQPVVAEIHHNESEGCGAANSCEDIVSARITNLATDDTTSSDQLGYRFAVVAGTPPTGFSLPTGTVRMPIYDGSFSLYWSAGADVDVTLNLFAVDAAGNQSAPQTLRIHEGTDACSVARSERRRGVTLAIVALLLAAAAARRRRGRRRATGALMAFVAMAGVVSPSRARACEPFGATTHIIDPRMAAVDQTPPTLAQPVVGDIARGEGEGCISSSKCRAFGTVGLTNLATDDMTAAADIGYRFTVVGGAAPPGLWVPAEPVRGNGQGFYLQWEGGYEGDVDFTIELVAVDVAGNESAPQTVRIHDDTGGCSVGRRHPALLTFVVVVLALGIAARRRPRLQR